MLGGWRKYRNEELLVCSIPYILRSAEWRNDGRWDEHKCVLLNTFNNLIGKHEGRHNSRDLM